MLRVGKVGLKVSLSSFQCRTYATELRPLGSLGLDARQVKTKKLASIQSQSICFAPRCKVQPPPYMPTRKDTNPCSNNGQGCSCSYSGWQRIDLLPHGILFCRGTIFWHLLSTIHLHWPQPKRLQGRALLGWLQLRPPQNPLAHFRQLDIRGRKAKLQLLPHLYIQPIPKGLLLLLHHLLWHQH